MAPADAPVPAAPGDAGEPRRSLTPAESAEYERLRRAASVRHRKLRRAGATVLLVVTLVFAPLAVVAAWVNSTVGDTDRYVQTVAPLAREPAVQNAVTDRLTKRVVDNIDVNALTASLTDVLKKSGAPPRVVDGSGELTGPLRGAITDAVHRVVKRVVTSGVFEEVWVTGNRRAQTALMNVLTGNQKGALRAQGEDVNLDIGVVVDQVKHELEHAGFKKASVIPAPDRTITLFRAEKLDKAQDAMRLLDIVGVWLPVVTLVLAALTVWTAPSHRLMLQVTAIGVGVMMIVLLIALAVARRVYLGSVPPAVLPPDAAAVVYDTLVRFLRDSARTLLVVAVITALAAYLYGPGRVARGVRSLSRRSTTSAGEALGRAGVRTGATGRWLDTHRKWTTGVVIAAGALTLVLWNHPTAAVVALVLCVVLVLLILLAVLASATGPGGAAGPGGPHPATS
ncbi:hypothetical protein [Streptomyces sp. CB01373]|uniref:hypothetical protein n=1 Tax=Streptomyces sp. CB01373 TaxID=2020325 RepID=UPI000C280FBB|nr:hypothetical protein [Streptomyces sp. CB01373]PJM96641.1 hypothetical protein CG719_05465 [Streptomyces sp. CB01373]